jgi:hypothetical protein
MLFVVMKTAKRIPTVIPMATVPGVGEEHILIFVIANPLTTTFGSYQSIGLST